MIFWLLAGLALHFLQNHLPPLLMAQSVGLSALLGPRDALPEPGKLAARASRAAANLSENLAPFLTAGLLAMIVPGTDMTLAILGATIFVLARVAYLALYLVGIPTTRSIAYWVGVAGNLVMLWAIL